MKRSPKEIKESIIVRPSDERGHAQHGWLDSYFTFSFAEYYDPAHMGFRSLRVINEDRVEAGMGFDTHPHRDMEIFTYVIEGALKHKDSMGHESTLKAGQVQKITAGTGIRHSEFNASAKEKVHLLQIWIEPQEKGLKPSYQEYSLALANEKNPLLLMGSPQGGNNVVQFNQDVYVYRGVLKEGKSVPYKINSGRGLWLQIVRGEIKLNGHTLRDGDGASVENVKEITLNASKNSEFLLFDLK